MTYRERREHKAERLREWADKRQARASSTLSTARQMADAIPFGQPILVGHHSETRDRNYRERIRSKFDRAYADGKKAQEMNSRADDIEAQAERAIYSDDGDAIEKLRERIADLEAQRDRVKVVNKLIRKTGLTTDALAQLTESERREIATLMRVCPYHQVETKGFPPYHLQNLSGNIARQRKRLDELSGAKTPRPRATDTSTATARAGLVVTASMTTPSRPGKQPRPVWNVTGDLTEWRSLLTRLGGTWYRGAFSFWEDPTTEIETACAESETPVGEVARAIEQAEATAPLLADPPPFALEAEPATATEHQRGLFNGKG